LIGSSPGMRYNISIHYDRVFQIAYSQKVKGDLNEHPKPINHY